MYFEFQGQVRQGTTWSPVLDVCERPTEIVIFVEMPGVNRTGVQISWDNGILKIAGHKEQEPSGGGVAAYLCFERSYGHFRRDIAIDSPINYKEAKAELRNGLLKVFLPKLLKKPEPWIIPIQE